MGFGPFSSSSETKLKAFEFGNIAASEGGQNVVIAGSAQGAVLPGGTLYKAKNINLSVTSTGTAPSPAGVVLADAIERQAAGAAGSPLPTPPPSSGDKKTVIVGIVVAVVFLGVIWIVGRKK